MTSKGIELLSIEGYALKRVPEAFLTRQPNSGHDLATTRTDSSSTQAINSKPKNPTDILPAEGIEALRRCFQVESVSQVLISARDFPSLVAETFAPSEPSGKEDDAIAIVNKPTYSRPNIATSYVEPTNEVEKVIVDIWQSILGLDKIGIHDNFMELGGNSLLAIQAVSRTVDSLHVEITIEDFFINPTPAEIAVAIIKQLATLTDMETLEQMLVEVEGLPDE